MRPTTPLAVENGVGKLAANARQMPAWERECGELPSPNLSLLDRKVGQGLFVFLILQGAQQVAKSARRQRDRGDHSPWFLTHIPVCLFARYLGLFPGLVLYFLQVFQPPGFYCF